MSPSRWPSAIRSIVFLDAFVPRNGDTTQNLTSAAVQEAIAPALARGALGMPPRAAEFFGVNAADRAWVDRLCTPQPIAHLHLQDSAHRRAREDRAQDLYSRQELRQSGLRQGARAVQSDPSWRTYEVACGHDVMVDAPERLSELLLEAAA